MHARLLALRRRRTDGLARSTPPEPVRVADAIKTLDLSYVVITSVDRDDLADGGASIFADTIRETRRAWPACRIEVLIPDFQGNEAALHAVLDARPDVLNHNTETVPRLYRMARSGGRYARTLELLDRVAPLRARHPDQDRSDGRPRREHDELVATFEDLRAVGCGILTIGQYLRPSPAHAPMVRYYHPDEFAELKAHRADARLRPRRIGAAGPQLVSRPRNRRRLRPRRAIGSPTHRTVGFYPRS